MHLMITQYTYKGRVHKHAKIVETIRENGVVKKKVIRSIGPIRTKEDEERARELLRRIERGEKLVALNELNVNRSLEHGMIYLTEKLWEKYGLRKSLGLINGKEKFDPEQIILLLIANRFYRPDSDLDAVEWINEEAYTNIRVKPQHVYRTLDKLIAKKEKIEKFLFEMLKKHFKLKVDVVFYDLTSTYFEGRGCESSGYGYSRDSRPDRKQIVLGLVMLDGIPIAHHVFPGNAADKTTLKKVVQDLKKRFDIQNIIFVADRGIFTIKNLDEIESENYEYILTTKRRRENLVKKLLVKKIKLPKGKKIFAKEVYREENRRYVLCMNTERRREDIEKLKEIKRNVKRKLDELRGKLDVQENVFKIIGKCKRLFNLKFENGFSFSLNKKAWRYENKIAGKFLLVTTTNLKPVELVGTYKDLKDIEEAFKEIKSFVKVRPIYHSRDRRVNAHMFVCVQSFLTECLIKKAIAQLKISARDAIREILRIKMIEIEADGENFGFRTKLTSKQKSILDAIGVEHPLRVNF